MCFTWDGKSVKVQTSALGVRIGEEAAERIVKYSVIVDARTAADTGVPRLPSASPSPTLEAYVLPRGVSWPFLSEGVSKQRRTSARNVLFIRTSPVDRARLDATREQLLQGEIVIWLGTSGIGKTAAADLLLMQILQRLHVHRGYPRHLVLRAGAKAWTMSSSPSSSTSVAAAAGAMSEPAADASAVTVREEGDCTLSQLRAVVSSLGCDRTCAVLELEELELDPHLDCAALVTGLSRDARQTFKTILKSGAARSVVSPWSREELLAAGLFAQLAASSATLSPTAPAAASIEAHTSDSRDGSRVANRGARMQRLELQRELQQAIDSKAEEVDGRFVKVGGLPRFVLGSQAVYQARLDDQDLEPAGGRTYPKHAEAFFAEADFRRLDVYNVPSSAQYLLAPFADPVAHPFTIRSAYFDFLTKAALIAYNETPWSPGLQRYLELAASESRASAIATRAAERIVSGALLCDNGFPERFRLKHWRFFKDQGPSAPVQPLPMGDTHPLVKEAEALTRFQDVRGRFVLGNFTALDSTCLYTGTAGFPGEQMALADCLQVVPGRNLVRLFQVSFSPPHKHKPILLSTLREFAMKLQLPETYNIEFVFLTDANLVPEAGPTLKRVRGIPFAETSGGPVFDIEQAKLKLKWKLSTVVVAAPFAPGVMVLR